MTKTFKRSNVRILLILMASFFLLAPHARIAAQGFDYDSYKETTLDEILDNPPDIQEGMDFFIKKRQFVVKVERYPEQCTARVVSRVLQMQGITNIPAVSHCMQVSSPKGKSVQVYVQDKIVDGLKEDVKLGDKIKVY